MQIEERAVGDVVVLDLKGRITLGEGDELLKDKVNSLVNQGHKKIVLNLAEVPYIDSAGPRRNRADLHDGQPPGRQPQAAEPDQADHRPAVDHEAADRVRDLRVGERRGPELLGIGQGLVRRPALDGAQQFFQPGGARCLDEPPRGVGSSIPRAQPAHLAAARPVDQEPAGLRRRCCSPSSCSTPTAGRSRRSRPSRSSARCRASSIWSTTSPTARPIGSIRSSGGGRSPRATLPVPVAVTAAAGARRGARSPRRSR